MFKFFLKKNFCDGWDNLFFLALSNIISILLGAAAFAAVRYSAEVNSYLPNLAIVLSSGIFMIFYFAWGANAARIADFGTPSISVFISSVKTVWRTGFFFGVMLSASLLVARYAIMYYVTLYLNTGSYVGLVLTALLGWFVLMSLIAFQWFIPLYFLQGNNGFKKCLKKSYIIFYDNLGFSVKVFIYNLILFGLSCPFLLIMPGLNGLLLSSTNALRLRLYKYDWIEKMVEKEPDFEQDRERRNEVPWEELIAEDKESLGPRKLIQFIFPWK